MQMLRVNHQREILVRFPHIVASRALLSRARAAIAPPVLFKAASVDPRPTLGRSLSSLSRRVGLRRRRLRVRDRKAKGGKGEPIGAVELSVELDPVEAEGVQKGRERLHGHEDAHGGAEEDEEADHHAEGRAGGDGAHEDAVVKDGL